MDYLTAAQSDFHFLSETYRWFHRHPEPSHGEIRTHAHIREILTQLGVPFDAPAPNITIGRLGREGTIVGLREDTDALQLTENTSLPYASEAPGLMHACGHDGHMAALLGAAKLLKAREETLLGRVKLIFQPAEEGEGGAKEVIATGLVDDVSAFFGIHLWSPYPVGEMRVSPGGVAASCDMFTLKLHGRAGHGAMPHECVDVIVCASALIQQLQAIASRFTSPLDPVVVTVGSLHAGTRGNIIAGEAVLEGTIRAFNPDTYAFVHDRFSRIIETCCAAYGCTWEMDMRAACGVTWNDERLTDIARRAAKRVDPRGAGDDRPFALGDDIADYRAVALICYAKVGVRSEAIGACHAHHSDRFRIDEGALPVAAAWLCEMAEEYLRSM